ncbi:hypothetical protein NEMIN01_1945 [Nematocida minor]|uniref:uncharacterized protein n=1 Tax=Nematocida minor TaxID=1912983 RepID=UPI00221F15DD|nr:uncharacterized protein NEMIN01_1945 [Nematocida minor]KAI5192316.1 hypothetical protein NEMIN01_1945 [Nematocida minor]
MLHYRTLALKSILSAVAALNILSLSKVRSAGGAAEVNLYEVKKFLRHSTDRSNSVEYSKIKIDVENNGVVFESKNTPLYIDLSLPLTKVVRNTLKKYTITNSTLHIHTQDPTKVKKGKLDFILAHFKPSTVVFSNISFVPRDRNTNDDRMVCLDSGSTTISESVKSVQFLDLTQDAISTIIEKWEVPNLSSIKIKNCNAKSLLFMDRFLESAPLEEAHFMEMQDLCSVKCRFLKSKTLHSITLQNISLLNKMACLFVGDILQNVKNYIMIDAWLFEKISRIPKNIISVHTLAINMPSITRMDHTTSFLREKAKKKRFVKSLIKAEEIKISGNLANYAVSKSIEIVAAWLEMFHLESNRICIFLMCSNHENPEHTYTSIIFNENDQHSPSSLSNGIKLEWNACSKVYSYINQISSFYSNVYRKILPYITQEINSKLVNSR